MDGSGNSFRTWWILSGPTTVMWALLRDSFSSAVEKGWLYLSVFLL